MIFFGAFILEIIILFFLSKRLIKALSITFYRIFKSHSGVVNALAVLFLPGTIVHELAHLLTAGIMLVPVGEISVLPEIGENEIKLGSVQIGKVDPFRLTIVGVAPVLIGMLSILGILYFAQTAQHLAWWQIVLGLYLIFEISNTMFSSKKDIVGTIGFVIGLLVVIIGAVVVLYFWRPLLLQNMWIHLVNLNWEPVTNFFKRSSLYLLVPFILDFLIILLTTPFIKRS